MTSLAQLCFILASVLVLSLTLITAVTPPVGKEYGQHCTEATDKDEDKCITGRGLECKNTNETCICRIMTSRYDSNVKKCIAPIGTTCLSTSSFQIDCANGGECLTNGTCVTKHNKDKKNSASMSTTGFGGLFFLGFMAMATAY